ncbi:hypothetical protein [Bradyrhizobium vignae]|uniref:hypothetical protein n=1 Tax=Bradyrhizobium vignae TaxID=1549949 RepID=UPI0011AE8042|nr:hypothetical protein [Bradyrhizobium vignae]
MLVINSAARGDCLDDFVAKNGSTISLANLLQDPSFQKCRGNPNPGARKAKLEKAATAAPVAAPVVNTRAPAVAQSQERPVPPPPPPEYATAFYPMLRSSFTDVWLFDKRKGVSDIADAEGAQFSYSDDRIGQNRAWSAHAMGAVVFQYLHDRYPKDGSLNFIGLSVAPYVQIDRISNSNPKAAVNNVDEVTFGGSAELGFDLGPGANYLRARGAGVEDRISGTSSGSGVLEWIPVIDGVLNSPFNIGTIPITFIFAPELKLRYDNVLVDDITGRKQYLARGGAQVFLKYTAIADALPDSIKNIGFLSSLHGQTTASWLTSGFDGRSYAYFNSSLTVNLDEQGYIGLSGSYTRGRSEDTGRKQDIWKLSLTGKL